MALQADLDALLRIKASNTERWIDTVRSELQAATRERRRLSDRQWAEVVRVDRAVTEFQMAYEEYKDSLKEGE